MSAVPLLNLPCVPRDMALRTLSPAELFELSLCSSRMATIVRSLNIRAEELKLTMMSGQWMVSVKFENKKQKSVWWDFKGFLVDDDLKEQRTISGVLFKKCGKFQSVIGVDEYYCNAPDMEEGIIAVSKHFSYIFPGPLVVEMNPTMIKDMRSMFSRPHLRRCKFLRLTGRTVPAELMAELFDNVTVEKQLIVRCETDEKYPILQALKVDTMYVEVALWMRREHLLDIDCRTADIRFNRFGCEDLEHFARKWKSGDNTRIEHVRIGWNTQMPFQLVGLDAIRWDSEKREESYILNYDGVRQRINCSRGYDLERDDGLLATFVYTYDLHNPAVHFFVWHERFPERKRIEQLPAQLAPLYRQLEVLNREYQDSSSLERMLANPRLQIDEFVDTYAILRNMDLEQRPVSLGRQHRRVCFDKMFRLIDLPETRRN